MEWHWLERHGSGVAADRVLLRGPCLVSIGFAWPGVCPERGRERTDRPCGQKDRMGEREEESGRTWPAELTLMEDSERRGASAVLRASFETAIKTEGAEETTLELHFIPS